jgi:hypothetical protein
MFKKQIGTIIYIYSLYTIYSIIQSPDIVLSGQEKELRAAGVPIPADYKGDKKSYTLPGDSDKGQCAVGVLQLG